jgi:hypothetical protein
MSWIVEPPNNNPSAFVLISSTVFQIDGAVRVADCSGLGYRDRRSGRTLSDRPGCRDVSGSGMRTTFARPESCESIDSQRFGSALDLVASASGAPAELHRLVARDVTS